jgi:membrane-bound lytic murein transglycosylase D
MGLDKFHSYLRTTVLASLMAAASACQTAQHPAALLPPASAPAIPQAVSAAEPQSSESAETPAQEAASPAKQSSASTQASSQAASTETTPKENANEPDQAGQPASSSPTSAAAASQPNADLVADLINQAEREYQAGLTAYHSGKTEEAKQDFDNALNALLSSNFDVRSDERLEKEFNRIVAGVDELYPGGTEADALTPGQPQEPQQKSEPAPIDQTNDLTPTPDASTKAKAEAEIKSTHSDLPLMMTDQVAGYIAYFNGRGRGVFERAYIRSGRYHDMIAKTLREEGVPQELIYLAQAESGFHPLAVSRVGARGIWQFMASRARGYGLSHNMYVDDRQDPEKSTRAAARHLKDLYNQFGDWYLAMAAYNSGPGTVQAAVKRTGYADFWELYRRNVLPKETRNYVPIILAVTIMNKNPSQYGLDGLVMDRPPDYDTIMIDYPVDLRLVAESINATTTELQDLNPSLLRLSTPRTGAFPLHLPAGSRDQYETAIASIPPADRLWWRYHTVHAGETIASLARTYHTTVKQISEANHLESKELDTDARLIIPVAPGKHPDSDATYARRITRYKVRHGDTVESVADNFGVSPQMLRRWNGIRGDSLSGRRVLALHLPVTPDHESEVAASRSKSKKTTQTASAKPPATKSAQIERLTAEDTEPQTSRTKKEELAVVHHKVKPGETLYSIATFYKTTVAALKRENRNVSTLRPGMILTIQLAR